MWRPTCFGQRTLWLCLLAFYLPRLDETTSCAYRDMPKPVQFPGCVPLHGRDFLDPVHDRSNEGYKSTLQICKKLKLASGIMVNSFTDLEPEIFKALKEAQGSQGFPQGSQLM
ncbi:hydroquinone glucosyltransferase-like [Prunus yedoensis var. nudiflora]|uniref:Hydroquinone glucosyltransferase-like n=1 Tax=Prunus yedoensis var. nudiflora TaxID=2094558 RepID=A0A314ZKJ5_PRUYE|nr:hydroquinone glucosyltransferase-like [Prunus yedoensis var. nudiflora]